MTEVPRARYILAFYAFLDEHGVRARWEFETEEYWKDQSFREAYTTAALFLAAKAPGDWISGAFNWSETAEGGGFWGALVVPWRELWRNPEAFPKENTDLDWGGV